MAKKKRGKKAQEKLNNGLFDASERGDVGEARKLLDQGEDANARINHSILRFTLR